jgi:transposase
VILEVGTHSPWIIRLVTACGHEAIVANPRRVRLIAQNVSKSDAVDAERLARLGRIDPNLLKPVVHRGEQAPRDRILLQARDGFVRARTQLINESLGFAKSLGTKLPSCSTPTFTRKIRATEGEDLFLGLATILAMIGHLVEARRCMVPVLLLRRRLGERLDSSRDSP